MPADISVIIPVFEERSGIGATLDRLRRLAGPPPREVIVVDGHPQTTTLEAIQDTGVVPLRSSKGRGVQMNRGAAAAIGRILLFLHADTRLPPGAFSRVTEVMADRRNAAGAFDLAIDSSRRALAAIAWMATRRSRLTGIPYGDQAVFVRRSIFDAVGGYRDIPIMEDVDLMRRIRRRGGRIGFIDAPAVTSPRRWIREGIVYGTLRNWTLISLYLAGVDPHRLARFYR